MINAVRHSEYATGALTTSILLLNLQQTQIGALIGDELNVELDTMLHPDVRKKRGRQHLLQISQQKAKDGEQQSGTKVAIGGCDPMQITLSTLLLTPPATVCYQKS